MLAAMLVVIAAAPQDCVLEVPSGTSIREMNATHLLLVHSDGQHYIVPGCTSDEQPYDRISVEFAGPLSYSKNYSKTGWHGWPEHQWFGREIKEYKDNKTIPFVTSLVADYIVPTNPVNPNGNPQSSWPSRPVISYWTGVQGPAILQPVIGWNNYHPGIPGPNANNWTLQSWNCCPAGMAVTGPGISGLQPGDRVHTEMKRINGTLWETSATWKNQTTMLQVRYASHLIRAHSVEALG
jgi:hypothetical protein